ncbi:hypothetical protein ACLQ2Y_25095 [Micromonospora echinospora]|uniref:hypothetical protein n=1 Tax=Micromonospora echinospora TaxID=1877 RepID=UPI003CED692F
MEQPARGVDVVRADGEDLALPESAAGTQVDGVSAKIDHANAFFRPLRGVAGVEVRSQSTVLYNSIYRFDRK